MAELLKLEALFCQLGYDYKTFCLGLQGGCLLDSNLYLLL